MVARAEAPAAEISRVENADVGINMTGKGLYLAYHEEEFGHTLSKISSVLNECLGSLTRSAGWFHKVLEAIHMTVRAAIDLSQRLPGPLRAEMSLVLSSLGTTAASLHGEELKSFSWGEKTLYGLRVLSGLLNFGKKVVSLVSLVVPALVPVQLSLYGIISMIQTVENKE